MPRKIDFVWYIAKQIRVYSLSLDSHTYRVSLCQLSIWMHAYTHTHIHKWWLRSGEAAKKVWLEISPRTLFTWHLTLMSNRINMFTFQFQIKHIDWKVDTLEIYWKLASNDPKWIFAWRTNLIRSLQKATKNERKLIRHLFSLHWQLNSLSNHNKAIIFSCHLFLWYIVL